MTLLELTDAIEQLALTSPIVHYAASGANVYTLNDRTVKDYAAVYVMPDGAHTVTSNTIRYHLTIFYIDKLTADLSNSEQLFSTGVQFLSNLLRGVAELDEVLTVSDDFTVENFIEPSYEKFGDMCGGAYASATVTVANGSTCFDGVVPRDMAHYEKAMQAAGYLYELSDDVAAIEASKAITEQLGDTFSDAEWNSVFADKSGYTTMSRGTVVHFPKGYLDNVITASGTTKRFTEFSRCRDSLNITIAANSSLSQGFNQSAFDNITLAITEGVVPTNTTQMFLSAVGQGTVTLKGDWSGVDVFTQMFQNSKFSKVVGLDLSAATRVDNIFGYCALREVEIVGYIPIDLFISSLAPVGGVGGIKRESIMQFIEAYGRRPDKSTTLHLSMGSTLLAMLTDEDKALAASYNLTLN